MQNRNYYRWEFAQSSRRHLIGRARIREVINEPIVVSSMDGVGDQDERIVFLGFDRSGRALKVIAVELEQGLLVIHAMDMRPKWLIFMNATQM